jgi:S-disulfanyl-L-cysteine oxidoreductase SoxD
MSVRTMLLLAVAAVVLVLGTTAGVLLLADDDDAESDDTAAAATPTTDASGPLPTPTIPVPGTPLPAASPPAEGLFGFGQPASESALDDWDIDIPPSGEGLPDGAGSVADGEAVYAAECASCHGPTGTEGGIGPQLVSEPGPYEPGTPRTIGSYWPYATTIWDYTYRAMPFDSPGSLSHDQVYAVTAWLLNANGIIPEGAVMDAESLPQVDMPNQPSFFSCWPETCRPDVTPAP